MNQVKEVLLMALTLYVATRLCSYGTVAETEEEAIRARGCPDHYIGHHGDHWHFHGQLSGVGIQPEPVRHAVAGVGFCRSGDGGWG